MPQSVRVDQPRAEGRVYRKGRGWVGAGNLLFPTIPSYSLIPNYLTPISLASRHVKLCCDCCLDAEIDCSLVCPALNFCFKCFEAVSPLNWPPLKTECILFLLLPLNGRGGALESLGLGGLTSIRRTLASTVCPTNLHIGHTNCTTTPLHIGRGQLRHCANTSTNVTTPPQSTNL